MLTQTNDLQRAREQAIAQLDGIIDMVDRLRHVQECQDPDPELCNLSDQEIAAGLGIYLRPGETVSEEDREQYHDEDDARQQIEEDPLDIEIRSDWHRPGDGDGPPMDYMILLCTGGPAVRIIGPLTQHSEPVSARIQYQDWFTEWSTLPTSHEQKEYMLDYARCFYFGE